MKTVAISATGENPNASVDQRFGLERFFILIDPLTQGWELFDNLANVTSMEDVGIHTAKSLIKNQVETVITGNCGSRAFKKLHELGVEVFLDAHGTVRQAFDNWRQGKFQSASDANMVVFPQCDDQG
jgi:predicted Fe-Mo cluster-binding NifX family protein